MTTAAIDIDTSPDAPAVTVAILDLFDEMRDALLSEHVERDREIHGILVALVAQLHILFLGGPGIAKSQMVDRTFLRITGAKYGKFPIQRMMSADDLFGPVDVRGYAEEGRFRRLLESFLADLDYANLEEVFKAGPSTLGMLYPTLNERIIRNDGKVQKIPLKVMMCSSNELPKDEGTAPLYDRIPLRYEVQPPQDAASIQRMLELELTPAELVQPILTGELLARAQYEASRLPFAPGVTAKLTELYFKLHEKGIRPTPRRLIWVRQAMRAEAWLDGSDIVAVEHMSIAAHGLWDLPGQAGDVEEVVLELANPLEKRTLRLLAGVAEIRKLLPAAVAAEDEEDQQARGMEIYHKIKEATAERDELVAAAGHGRRQRDLLESSRTALHEVLVDMLRDVMHLPPEEIAQMTQRTAP